MIVCGIDCGLSGALAFLSDSPADLCVYDTPLTEKGTVDWEGVVALFGTHCPQQAIIEICFNNLGLVKMAGGFIALLSYVGVPTVETAVVSWKKALFGENHKDKERSIALCQQLYPKADLWRPTPKGKKKNLDHNRAEAVLLAHYLRQRLSVPKSGD